MATKKSAATAPKAAAKKAAKKETETPAKKGAPKKEGGKIQEILELHRKGLTNAQIIEKGYNKSTVGIQVAKYKRENGK